MYLMSQILNSILLYKTILIRYRRRYFSLESSKLLDFVQRELSHKLSYSNLKYIDKLFKVKKTSYFENIPSRENFSL